MQQKGKTDIDSFPLLVSLIGNMTMKQEGEGTLYLVNYHSRRRVLRKLVVIILIMLPFQVRKASTYVRHSVHLGNLVLILH